MSIDQHGLDEVDRKLLKIIAQHFSGGPVGLGTLAAALQEEAGTIEDIFEPYLMQLGFLARTAKGRVLTEKAYEYLGLDKKDSQKLF
jgi:Holliday junction DNA helicase RuvB